MIFSIQLIFINPLKPNDLYMRRPHS